MPAGAKANLPDLGIPPRTATTMGHQRNHFGGTEDMRPPTGLGQSASLN